MGWNSLDLVFKKLINKRVTDSSNKAFYNEFSDNTINTSLGEIWTDPIPGDPSGAPASIVQAYTNFVLTCDPSVPGKQCWFATSDPTHTTNQAARLKDWISDKYTGASVSPGYAIVLKDQNGTQISTVDISQWYFDYQTGILVFNGTTTGTGITIASATSFTITGYRYVGRKGLDYNIAKNPARLATVSANVSGWTYDSPSQTITCGGNSASLSIDGVAVNAQVGESLSDRILVKDMSSSGNNGIYYVSQVGTVSLPWKITRSSDANASLDIFGGMSVFVLEGNTQASTIWTMINGSFTTLDAAGSIGTVNFARDTGTAGMGSGTVHTLAMFVGSTSPTNMVGDSIVSQDSSSSHVTVLGHLEATTKSFNIAHPDKPGMRLIHGCLEGPEHGVYVRGTITGSGDVCVNLPSYWANLVGDEYTVTVSSRGKYGVYVQKQDRFCFTVSRYGPFWQRKRTYEFSFLAIGARIGTEFPLERTE